MDTPRIVLILGSAPSAIACRDWSRGALTDIVAINNAWRIRPDWDYLIHPDDFPPERWPQTYAPGQIRVTSDQYVPLQNSLGGFVFAGGTMAFTAGYWALGALKPRVLAFFGCDMVYPASGNTHFYGQGAADPLREDVTLRSLEAKSARLMLLAARQGCSCVNLSDAQSRLVFPRVDQRALAAFESSLNPEPARVPLAEENRLGYLVPSGRYWKCQDQFDLEAIDALDQMWLDALAQAQS